MRNRNQTANILTVKIEKKNVKNVKVQTFTKKKDVKDFGHTKNLKVKS